MEELLSRVSHKPLGFAKGQKVTARVVEVGNKSLTVDLGAKSEGLVIEREFDAAKPYIKTLKPGDVIDAHIVVPESESGNPLLSLRETSGEFVWALLEKKIENKETVDIKVDQASRGGVSGLVYGINAFVPTFHLSREIVDNPMSVLDKTLKVRVIEVDRAKNKLVLSEKAVSESGEIDRQNKILAGIKNGDEFTGRVTRVVSFGAFVEVEKDGVPLEGLVHLSEISWQKVISANEALTEGSEVRVVVISTESRNGSFGARHLAFSIKQLTTDPWDGAIGKYKPEQQVRGRVTKVGTHGAFVELEPGVEGLIHASKIPAGTSLKEDDTVDVFIDEIDKGKKKLGLGLVLKSKPVGYK